MYMTLRNPLVNKGPQPTLAERLAYLEAPLSVERLSSRLIGKRDGALALRMRLAQTQTK
jgi:hypothetical protein